MSSTVQYSLDFPLKFSLPPQMQFTVMLSVMHVCLYPVFFARPSGEGEERKQVKRM